MQAALQNTQIVHLCCLKPCRGMHATSGERGLQSHASGAARPRATQLPEPPPGSATAGPGDEEEANPALELRDSDENINTQSWCGSRCRVNGQAGEMFTAVPVPQPLHMAMSPQAHKIRLGTFPSIETTQHRVSRGPAITASYLSEEGGCIHRGNGSCWWTWDLLGSLHLGTAGDPQRLVAQITVLQGL